MVAVLFIPINIVVVSGLEVMPHGSDPLVRLWSKLLSGLYSHVSNPYTTALTLAVSVVPALLLVPAQIFINPPLSPAERAQLLCLSTLPQGLVASALVVIRYAVGKALPASALFGGVLPIILLATAILTPLDVMAASLTLLRHSLEALATPVEPLTPDVPSMYAEPVMHFRTEVPYTCLLDCGCKIVAESAVVRPIRGR
jgi:hypothetical protein